MEMEIFIKKCKAHKIFKSLITEKLHIYQIERIYDREI